MCEIQEQCSWCGTVNRINFKPVCGQCKKPLQNKLDDVISRDSSNELNIRKISIVVFAGAFIGILMCPPWRLYVPKFGVVETLIGYGSIFSPPNPERSGVAQVNIEILGLELAAVGVLCVAVFYLLGRKGR